MVGHHSIGLVVPHPEQEKKKICWSSCLLLDSDIHVKLHPTKTRTTEEGKNINFFENLV